MMYLNKDEVLEFLKEKNFSKVKESLEKWFVQDIAEFINELDETSAVLVFKMLPKKKIADTFSYLEPEDQERLLNAFTNKEAEFILSNLSPDDRTELFEELPGIITRRLFKLLSVEDLKETKSLLGYPEESVGRMMTPDYVYVYKNMTVKETIDRIRKWGRDSETIARIYVIDSKKRLLGTLKLRKVILTDPKAKIKDIMNYNVVKLSAFDDREEAVKIMKKYDLTSVPVVDSEGIIIGIVTIDDVLDVAEEEVTEDIQKISSVTPLKTSYKTIKVFTLYKKRVLWISLLLVIGLATSGILAYYEEVLSSAIILAVFIPLLIDSAGNMGSQSATLMIRAIATGDVELDEWFKVFVKEIIIGLMIGVTMGIFATIIGIFRGGYIIGVIIGLTMLSIILISNLIGASLPFILSKLNIDPAVASSPLITTIADICGLIIYFNIATLLLLNNI